MISLCVVGVVASPAHLQYPAGISGHVLGIDSEASCLQEAAVLSRQRPGVKPQRTGTIMTSFDTFTRL